MNTIIETARALAIECIKENPELAEVQRICDSSFIDLQKPPLRMRPVFADADEQSGDPAKATFTALNWVRDNAHGAHPSAIEGEFNIFAVESEKCELHCLTKVLSFLHNIQLRKDDQYMDNLRRGYSDFRDRFIKDE